MHTTARGTTQLPIQKERQSRQGTADRHHPFRAFELSDATLTMPACWPPRLSVDMRFAHRAIARLNDSYAVLAARVTGALKFEHLVGELTTEMMAQRDGGQASSRRRDCHSAPPPPPHLVGVSKGMERGRK